MRAGTENVAMAAGLGAAVSPQSFLLPSFFITLGLELSDTKVYKP